MILERALWGFLVAVLLSGCGRDPAPVHIEEFPVAYFGASYVYAESSYSLSSLKYPKDKTKTSAYSKAVMTGNATDMILADGKLYQLKLGGLQVIDTADLSITSTVTFSSSTTFTRLIATDSKIFAMGINNKYKLTCLTFNRNTLANEGEKVVDFVFGINDVLSVNNRIYISYGAADFSFIGVLNGTSLEKITEISMEGYVPHLFSGKRKNIVAIQEQKISIINPTSFAVSTIEAPYFPKLGNWGNTFLHKVALDTSRNLIYFLEPGPQPSNIIYKKLRSFNLDSKETKDVYVNAEALNETLPTSIEFDQTNKLIFLPGYANEEATVKVLNESGRQVMKFTMPGYPLKMIVNK
jgi:hypothetical protein